MADNLNIPMVAAAQNQKEVTINAATAQLSGAIADFLSCDLSAADYVLTNTNFEQYMGFATTGNTVARAFTISAVKRAIFYIQNGGTSTVTVTVGSTTLGVPPESVGFFQTDGTTNGLASVAPVALGGEVDVGFVLSGLPLASQKVNYPANQGLKLPASLTGSNFAIGTNPSSNATFTLNKNGSSIGTIVIGTAGGHTITFTADVTFAAGDIFNLTAPTSQDATLADVGFNFKFTKT